jgi:hypothetical protein
MPLSNHAQKLGRCSFLALSTLLVAGTSGCLRSGQQPQTLIALAQQYTPGDRQAAARLECNYGGVSEDAVAVARITRIGRELTAAVPGLRVACRFRLLNARCINAFSLAGGYVYVTKGLYDRLTTDDLIAAAIAHELAHLVARDGLKPCHGNQARLEREMQADSRAFAYLEASRFDSSALVRLLEIIRGEQEPGWADTRVAHLTRASDPHHH